MIETLKNAKKEVIIIDTSKKQKFIGTKILFDAETGEEYPMQLNVIEDRDFNFHKFWLQNFIHSMDDVMNQKMQVAFWIIENLDSENKLIMTQRELSEKSGISLQTVNRTLKILQESEPPFLLKMHSGAYRINPNILFKGSHSNRMGVAFQFRETENEIREKKAKEKERKGKKADNETQETEFETQIGLFEPKQGGTEIESE